MLRDIVQGGAVFLDEIEKRADEMCKAERLYRKGKLKRVCHCDTKVNNMMFDARRYGAVSLTWIR